MKELLWIKRIDLGLQILCLVLPASLAIMQGSGGSLYLAYFTVGGSQVLSCLVHLAARDTSWIIPARSRYSKTLLVALALAALVAFAFWSSIDVLGVLALCIAVAFLFLTPVMAVWYFIICGRETASVRRLVEREMILVK